MLPSANDVMLRINDVGCAQRCCLRQTGQSLRHDFVVPRPAGRAPFVCYADIFPADGEINPLHKGERWERCRGQMKRPERVAAVGEGRRRTVAEDIRRAPQQDHMQA